MKTALHPPYFLEAKVVCACGNTFTTGATVSDIKVDVCSNCHPFYTGKEKLVDTEGRVERFQRRMNSKIEAKPKKVIISKEDRPSTLRDMLMQARKSQG